MKLLSFDGQMKFCVYGVSGALYSEMVCYEVSENLKTITPRWARDCGDISAAEQVGYSSLGLPPQDLGLPKSSEQAGN